MINVKSVALAAMIVVGTTAAAPAAVLDTGATRFVTTAGPVADFLGNLLDGLRDKVRDRKGPGSHPVPGPAAAAGLPFLIAAGAYGLFRWRRRNRDY